LAKESSLFALPLTLAVGRYRTRRISHMKTTRYILSITALILGFYAGWFLFGQSLVNWGIASEDPYFNFMHDDLFPFFSFFFKFSFGVIGLLLASYLAIKIWPRDIDNKTLKIILDANKLFLITLPLTIVVIFGLYWWDWTSGDRDFCIPIIPILGCGIGFLIWTTLFGVLQNRRKLNK
jgi:hypothetical protein